VHVDGDTGELNTGGAGRGQVRRVRCDFSESVSSSPSSRWRSSCIFFASPRRREDVITLSLAGRFPLSEAGHRPPGLRLIDREAVLSGAAAAGKPWQHYDIGHGYCSYTFFEQCPHRMACARCDFYIPKPSGKAQMLKAKADVDRRLALIPLTDGERAAIEQDRLALDRLLEGLADTPTPAGPTPRELAERPSSVNDIAISPSTAGWEDLTTPTGIRNPIDRPLEDRTF
jgi:hypothetical protein